MSIRPTGQPLTQPEGGQPPGGGMKRARPDEEKEGAELQVQLAKSGMHVPLVTYNENQGKLDIYTTAEYVPPRRK
jgi:hypothetical protein